MKLTKRSGTRNQYKTIGKIQKVKIAALVGLIAVISVGCSGGGSSSDSGNDSVTGAAPLIEGQFIDSPVQGLDYMTDTHSGITDAEGRFICLEGEMITFMIGDVMLGQAMAEEVITPMHFLDESEMPFDVTHPMITNMGRFLQSLDSDGDPENGITITDEIREEMIGRMIDFHQSIEDFENDPHVAACFDTLNGLNMPHRDFMWGLEPTEEVRQHMREHMGRYMEFKPSDDPDTEGEFPMNEWMDDHMGSGFSGGSDEDINPPMNGFTDSPMEEHMEDYMGFDDTEGDDNFGTQMGEWMDDESMYENMEDHMSFGSSDDPDTQFEHPMDEFMDDAMYDYMEEHMGQTGSGSGDDFEHPMRGYMVGSSGYNM